MSKGFSFIFAFLFAAMIGVSIPLSVELWNTFFIALSEMTIGGYAIIVAAISMIPLYIFFRGQK